MAMGRRNKARRRASGSITAEEGRTALILFNEKAERLARSSFLKQLDETPLSLTLTFGVDDPEISSTAPGEDPVDAFVLTLRFFLQDKEPSSFRRLADVYETLPIPEALRKRFRTTRRNLNAFLDSLVAIGIVMQGNRVGPRRRD